MQTWKTQDAKSKQTLTIEINNDNWEVTWTSITNYYQHLAPINQINIKKWKRWDIMWNRWKCKENEINNKIRERTTAEAPMLGLRKWTKCAFGYCLFCWTLKTIKKYFLVTVH